MGAVRPKCARRGAIALLTMLAPFFGTASAKAYCREVILAAPSGWNPAVDGCFIDNPDGGGDLPQLFWRNQCVGYSLQLNASKQVSLSDAQLVASQAFAAWNNAACPGGGSPGITASALAPVECDEVPSQEHNNVIMFRDDGWPYTDSANSIGLTTLTVYKPTGEILGADIEINSYDYTIVATGTPPPMAYDLASILTHEAGHFLGMAHSTDTSAVMYAYYHPGSTTLEPDDIAGICTIYPPDGTRNTQAGPVAATTCNTAPLLGFEDQCGSLDASAEEGDAGDGGDGPVGTDTLTGCASIPRPPGAPAWLPGVGLLALGLLRRRRRATKTSLGVERRG